MLTTSFKITDDGGLHARPCAQLVKAVNESPCDVTFTSGEFETEKNSRAALSLMALMLAAISTGAIMEVKIQGAGENERQSLSEQLQKMEFWQVA